MKSFNSILLLLIIGLVAGCGTSVTKVEVAQQVSLDCGPEPQLPLLVLKPVEPTAVYDPVLDQSYVRIEIPDYEDMAINMKRIGRHLKGLSAIIVSYRQCIEDFNGAQQPSE